MPLQPTITRLVRRRMKSPVASSSSCTRSKVLGLKFQLKASSVLFSAKRASRMRRATARSRRPSASAPSSRSRKLRCEKFSFSARVSSSSRTAASTGMRRVAKWLRQRSRSGIFGSVVLPFVGFIAFRRFLQQHLVIGRGTRSQRSPAQYLVQMVTRIDGQRFHRRAWPGLRGQNALHCRPREGAIPYGSLQRASQILAAINGQQTEYAPGFVFAVAPGAQQFVEEANSVGPELGETLLQQLAFVQVIASRSVRRQAVTLSTDSGGKQLMPGDLLYVRAVDDQFVLGDAHRQQFADALPGHGVEVLQIQDVAIGVHGAVENAGRVVRPSGQREQMRLLLLEQVDWPPFGFPMHAYIGCFGQPAQGHLVQMLQGGEGPPVQQVGFDIPEWPLDLPLRFGPARATGPWPKGIMRGEGKEAGVVDRLIAIVSSDDHLHVVVETGGRQPLKVLESAHVFADGVSKVL